MLRNLAALNRMVYTCTFVPCKIPKHSEVNAVCQRWLRSSPAVNSLDKDVRNKKQLIERATSAKQESLFEDDTDVKGLSEMGITIPTPETPSMLVNGVRYDELPIVHIKSSLNNTIMTMNNFKGETIYKTSCGIEGFRNVKKSTNVAGQATGLSMGQKALKKGVTAVRIIIEGLGAGRLASIKGLQMAGLNIVSITDNTPIPHNGPRPRKAKRR